MQTALRLETTVLPGHRLEITAERAQKINFSNPYFYSTLTITRRVDDNRVQRVEDLRGLTTGVLKVTFAERYVQSLGNVVIRSYDGQVQPFIDLVAQEFEECAILNPDGNFRASGQGGVPSGRRGVGEGRT